MKISEKGLALIKEFEGCRLAAYQDSVGVWTIGYGTTNADKAITGTNISQGLQISQATADEWLRRSIDTKYGPKVDKYSRYGWNQNEFDALVSFAYNIGSIDQLTANGTRTRVEIADKITAYNKAGGKVLAGLIRRRREERALFLAPVDVKTGWLQEDGYWRFYYHDNTGKCVKDAWYNDGGKWYWFDENGYMVTGLQLIEGKWYYFYPDGKMATKPVTFTPTATGALQYPE